MSSFSSGFQTLIKNFSLCFLLMCLRTCHERFRVPDCLGVPYAGPYVFHLAFPQKKKGEPLCTGINIVINYFGLSLFTNYCTCYLGISRFPEECF